MESTGAKVRSLADYTAENLYQRLGVSEEATEEQIRAAYKLALRKVHPDLKSDLTDAERARYDDVMKGVNEARDTLLDP